MRHGKFLLEKVGTPEGLSTDGVKKVCKGPII